MKTTPINGGNKDFECQKRFKRFKSERTQFE